MLHLLKVWECSEQNLGPKTVLVQLTFYIFNFIILLSILFFNSSEHNVRLQLVNNAQIIYLNSLWLKKT